MSDQNNSNVQPVKQRAGGGPAVTKGTIKKVKVHGPLMEETEATYGEFNGDSAIIEMAAASGLPMVPTEKRNPLNTTSYGTGELIKDALDSGYRKISIAIGGSATNDGGMGMLVALGVRFLDYSGKELRGCGSDLEKVETIDTSGLHPAIKETEFTVMCDVTNPLLGPEGATFTFSAQKGAAPAMQQQLENGMNHYSCIVEQTTGIAAKEVPGAGAAGGLGFALMSFLGARLQSGNETVLDLVHFDEALAEADLVVTGEGRMDWQSSYGKVPAGVGKRCQKAGIPAVAIVGGLLPGYQAIYETGIQSVVTTVNGVMPLEQALQDSESLYLDAAIRLFRAIRCGMSLGEN